MKQITIRISTANAAFDPEPLLEVARILRRLADSMEATPQGPILGRLADINGKAVGEVRVRR